MTIESSNDYEKALHAANCITKQSLHDSFNTLKFFYDSDGKSLELKEGIQNATEIHVPGLEESISLYTENHEVKASYNGNFYLEFNFPDQKLVDVLLTLPPSIRLFCHDCHNRITMAHAVCRHGQDHLLKHFLRKENGMLFSISGYTPLHCACLIGNLDTVKSAVEHGGIPEIKKQGW